MALLRDAPFKAVEQANYHTVGIATISCNVGCPTHKPILLRCLALRLVFGFVGAGYANCRSSCVCEQNSSSSTSTFVMLIKTGPIRHTQKTAHFCFAASLCVGFEVVESKLAWPSARNQFAICRESSLQFFGEQERQSCSQLKATVVVFQVSLCANRQPPCDHLACKLKFKITTNKSCSVYACCSTTAATRTTVQRCASARLRQSASDRRAQKLDRIRSKSAPHSSIKILPLILINFSPFFL